jgi:hypothetical protein
MKLARKKTKSTKSPGLKLSKKGVIKILSVVVIAAIFAWFFVITHLFSDSTEEASYAAPRNNNSTNQVVLEAEEFSTYSLSGGLQTFDDTTASNGKGMMFSINTTAEGNVTLPSPISKLTVVAKSNRCHGGPTMVVRVGDMEVLNKKIPAESWNNFNANINLSAGSQRVTVTFLNDYATESGQGCDRTLFVDKLIFQ